MSRYIDADKLESELFRDGIAGIFLGYPRRRKYTIGEIRGMLKNERIAPTADVVEVRHGEWEYEQLDEYKFYKVTCPYCNAYYMGNYDAYHDPDDFNYCPNCGAKMDGERSENGKS